MQAVCISCGQRARWFTMPILFSILLLSPRPRAHCNHNCYRFTRSLIGVPHFIWACIFLGAECIMAIGSIVGHSSRSFPVHREKVTPPSIFLFGFWAAESVCLLIRCPCPTSVWHSERPNNNCNNKCMRLSVDISEDPWLVLPT